MTRTVGILGAGPGVSALHLPTLARVPELFRVVALADAGSGRAEALAARWDAAAFRDAGDLVRAPGVDVVLVCSPPALHAAHIRQAVDAGVRAILCEKPLAMTAEDAREVVELARAADVALLVGTNHLYDPAWPVAKGALADLGGDLRTIGVTLVLPPNGRYHALVAEFDRPDAAPPRGAPDWSDRELAASVVRQLVLGLGIHDLPAVRDLAPDFERIDYARAVPPIGYAIGLQAAGVRVQLTAVMLPDGPDAHWRLSIGTSRGSVDVDYPPAFVHAGSATVRVRTAEGQRIEHRTDPGDGYAREWRALAALIDGEHPTDYDAILDDALFAIAIADGAAAHIRGAAR